MKGKIKGFLICVTIFALLSGTLAIALNTTTLYNVMVSGVKIIIDGKEFNATDAGGHHVEPIIYNGTTYLPVRAIAGAFDKPVYWDGENFTVYLGAMEGRLEYPSVYLKDMTNITSGANKFREINNPQDNYGNKYGYGFGNSINPIYAGSHDSFCEVLANMKYSRFKGTLYVPEGTTIEKVGRLKIEVDGKVKYTSEDMTNSSRPVNIDISVKGANDIKFILEGINGGLYLADAGFYQ